MIHRDHRPLVSEDMQLIRMIVRFGSGHDIFPDISDDGLSYIVQPEELVLSDSPSDSSLKEPCMRTGFGSSDQNDANESNPNSDSFKDMIASLERISTKIERIKTDLKEIRSDLPELSISQIRSRLDDVISKLG